MYKKLLLLTCSAIAAFASSFEEADNPQLAANGSGNVVAFWEEFQTDHFVARYANYLAESGWQSAASLSSGSTTACDPEASMNLSGNMIAVWKQSTGAYYAIYAATGTLGSSWNTPIQLSSNDSIFPRVQIDADGKGVALWQERASPTTFRIATSSFIPASGWSTATHISSASKIQMCPKTTISSNGRTVAVWNIPTVPGPFFGIAVQGSFYSANSGWSTPVIISNTQHDATIPSVGASSTGEALAVWVARQATGGVGLVQAATLSTVGTWGSPVTLSDGDLEASYPKIAMNNAGQAVVVWQAKEPGSSTVSGRAIVRSAGGTWGSILSFASSGVSYPEVSINSGGKAVAIWIESRETDALLKASIYSSGSWLSPQTVSSESKVALHPEIRVNTDGSACVVWQSDDLAGIMQILSARLDTDNNWSAPRVIN